MDPKLTRHQVDDALDRLRRAHTQGRTADVAQQEADLQAAADAFTVNPEARTVADLAGAS